MESLKLHWLGHPLIELKGWAVKLETRKVAALLVYLSLNPGACPRDVLATMFWQESNQTKALANLRRTLSSLNSSLPGWIDANRESIALKRNGKLWVDVESFQQSLPQLKQHNHPGNESCEECLSVLDETAKLYRGEFLDGLNLSDSPSFDEWQFFQRDGLRQEFAKILQRLASGYSERGQWDQAISCARHWLTLDRLHEPACRALIDLYTRSGQSTAALRQYDELARSLKQQMGQEPEEETRRLYEQIRGRNKAKHVVELPERSTSFLLLKTKLYIPSPPISRVIRSNLIECLGDLEKKALTIISAPAGFGKTTLLAEWIEQTSLPVAWLSLDNGDNDPYRFLSYLIAALESIHEDVGLEARQIMRSSQFLPTHIILASLINDLGKVAERYVLVLDDYQFITEHAVHETMSYLLDHIPSSMHVVISTRADPPLQVGRLRVQEQMLELRTRDLRFTSREAMDFLNGVMLLGLSSDDIEILEERTEGWVVGLKMAALSIQEREDASDFIRAFSGSHRYVLDYLVEEVLRRQPAHIQTFLLQTSVLEKLNSSLCETLMSDEWMKLGESAQGVLEYLERNNLFLMPLDDNKQWYRYHHLFGDLLQARIRQSEPGLAVQLLSRASAWCEREGKIPEAVGYALTAKDYTRAGDQIAKYWELIVNDANIETAWFWLNALPERVVRNSAPLSITYCWMLWLKGQISRIEKHLAYAERVFNDMNISQDFSVGDEAHGSLPAEIAALHSFVERYHNEYEAAIAYAKHAISLLPAIPSHQVSDQLRSPIYLALATAYNGAGDLQSAVDAYAESIHWSRLFKNVTGLSVTYLMTKPLLLLGRLREADQSCREALRFVEEQGMSRLPAAGILHVALSEILVEQNELDAADSHLALGFELGKESGRLDAVRNAAAPLTRLRLARGDASGALAAIKAAESALGEPLPPTAMSELLALRARILLQQGSVSEAAQCAQEAVNLAGRDRGQTGQLAALVSSRVLLAQCNPDEAIAQLTPSIVAAEECGQMGVVIELRVLLSLAFLKRGDMQEAEADMERLLALAEPEGYIRMFLDEGESMIKLLKRLRKSKLAHPLKGYVNRLLEASTPV